jgi:hypothetical protein
MLHKMQSTVLKAGKDEGQCASPLQAHHTTHSSHTTQGRTRMTKAALVP